MTNARGSGFMAVKSCDITPSKDSDKLEVKVTKRVARETEYHRLGIDSYSQPRARSPARSSTVAPPHSCRGDNGTGGGGGTASRREVAITIFVSFVGAGILGMPYAFSRSGWLLGTASLLAVSAANVYAMLLLVKTRRKLHSEGRLPSPDASFGDVGHAVAGPAGRGIVNACIVSSQVGFAVAYIIFISTNLERVGASATAPPWLPRLDRAQVCFGCVPVLACLVQAREIKTLSPFSSVANVANVLGIAAVLVRALQTYYSASPHDGGSYYDEGGQQQPQQNGGEGRGPIVAVQLSSMIYATGVAIYGLEGAAVVLSFESSMKRGERDRFPRLLASVMGVITALTALFGIAGYVAYGADTSSPVTLNLTSFPSGGGGGDGDGTAGGGGGGGDRWVTFVELALILGQYLAYPIQLFPVHDALEGMSVFRRLLVPSDDDEPPMRRKKQRVAPPGSSPLPTLSSPLTPAKTRMAPHVGLKRTMAAGRASTAARVVLLRGGLVLFTATVAYAIPDFGSFLSLVGLSSCTILGFVVPCWFHLKAFGIWSSDVQCYEVTLDVLLILSGVVFSAVGTYSSLRDLLSSTSTDARID